jgi:uncharacterized membrane protein YfcA
MLLTYLGILITGVMVSFISTLFGLGGGILMVPVLSLILPYQHLEAVATSLATITLVASFNTYNFKKQKVIVWQVVPWIAATSALFSFISAEAASYIPERALVIVFILFLTWVALRTFLIKGSQITGVNEAPGRARPLLIGTISGLVSGVTGIGGGGITTPLMLVSRIATNIQASPTSNAIMIFTALFGALAYAMKEPVSEGAVLGYIHYDTTLFLFAGSALFSRIGVRMNNQLPVFWRKTVLGLLLVFICARLVYKLI